MAVDTFVVYVGVYPSVDVESDYELVKALHTKANMLDVYDAAVIERENGKVRITKKHETPTRVGGVLGGGVGLATGLVVACFRSPLGGGLLAATTAGGAYWARWLARSGWDEAAMTLEKELGEYLDAGQVVLSSSASWRWQTTSSSP